MRDRKYLEKSYQRTFFEDPHERSRRQLELEVLLDIRELLSVQDDRPAVTHPKSPPPPEVG